MSMMTSNFCSWDIKRPICTLDDKWQILVFSYYKLSNIFRPSKG